MRNIHKKPYQKPEILKINIDNKASIQMLSENGIPDSPPWDSGSINISKKNEPFKTYKA